MSVADEFAARSIASQEHLLGIAKRERAVTSIMSIVMLSLVTIAVVTSWPTWVSVVAGLGLGWFVSRHLRARRFINSTTRLITRLRGL